jgi:hypothetical protein
MYVEVDHQPYDVDVETVTFVNLETGTFDGLTRRSTADVNYDQTLVRINEEASKDLGCDRSDVAPELISLGPRSGLFQPVAIGCGRVTDSCWEDAAGVVPNYPYRSTRERPRTRCASRAASTHPRALLISSLGTRKHR